MRIVPLALLAAFALPLPMLADTYTYSYTGNDFGALIDLSPSASQVFTTSNFITIDFTLSAPLADNMTDVATSTTITPDSFTASDGYQTFTNLNATVSVFDIDTDASGQITYWNILAGTINGGTQYYDQSFYIPGTYFVDQALFDATSPTTFVRAQTIDNQGTWTVTDNSAPAATPEPSSFILLGTGMMGVAAAIRRRLAA
jgi:hypothetical protein